MHSTEDSVSTKYLLSIFTFLSPVPAKMRHEDQAIVWKSPIPVEKKSKLNREYSFKMLLLTTLIETGLIRMYVDTN
jgi:hypothetical protein